MLPRLLNTKWIHAAVSPCFYRKYFWQIKISLLLLIWCCSDLRFVVYFIRFDMACVVHLFSALLAFYLWIIQSHFNAVHTIGTAWCTHNDVTLNKCNFLISSYGVSRCIFVWWIWNVRYLCVLLFFSLFKSLLWLSSGHLERNEIWNFCTKRVRMHQYKNARRGTLPSNRAEIDEQ